MFKTIALVLGVSSALMLMPAAADAQKSKDTLRLAITDMFGGLDFAHFPHDEAGSLTRTIYETLVVFDERKKVYVPRLAKSWKRIDSTTLEFELRDDVRFHSGNKFDADDVQYTIAYLSDPETKIRFKERYDWATVEKLGPYKIRVTSKKPFATDLQTIAYRIYIYDSRAHKKLENKADYGRVSPSATGPYRIESMDPHKGIVMERFDGYYGDRDTYPAPVGRVHGIPIPDRQTQLAHLMTGGIDLIRDVPADIARELANRPDAKVTATSTGTVVYVTLDAAGRSANKALTDQRVRKAFMMAVDRDLIRRTVIPGGETAQTLDAICHPANVACSATVKPPSYNPDEAKRLLAEAGFPNGFDLELSVYAPIKEIGEAIAGQVRQVGIRASVRPLPLSLFVRLRGQGQLTTFTSLYPTSAQPDVGNLFDFFFSGNRDYWMDPAIQSAKAAGDVEFDDEKRVAIYEKALDRINEMAYILPVAELPTVWAHGNDVRIADNPLSSLESRLGDWTWR